MPLTLIQTRKIKAKVLNHQIVFRSTEPYKSPICPAHFARFNLCQPYLLESITDVISLFKLQIYHKVFMNNILGFSVLVSVIYFRGLTWHFSAEILVVVIVCIIMGLLASIRSKFPNWTLFIAFPLYPLSLVVVYLVDDTFRSA